MAHIAFYVNFPYYFPHFLTISSELRKRGHKTTFVLSAKSDLSLMERIARENEESYTADTSLLYSNNVDVVFFGNRFSRIGDVQAKTVFLEHGIGTKSTSFYPAVTEVDIYLVEGTFKYNRIKELFPEYENRLRMVGFSKFDYIKQLSGKKEEFFFQYGINPKKKTILYAPTFFPSSIERMANDFPKQFEDCNIIVKPHYLSYGLQKYKSQRTKLFRWSAFDNCFVMGPEESNIVPFLIMADVMISDESSAMFEFAGLNKPVISNRFFKLRWSYYILPWKLSKRIDSGKGEYRNILRQAHSYKESVALTKDALVHPDVNIDERKKFIEDVVGIDDGKVSIRIADIVEKELL